MPDSPASTSATSTGTGRPGRPRRPKERPSVAARRAGYVLGAVANVVLWVAIHVWPGWDTVPFLTDATTQVLPWVDAALAASVAANALWLVVDPRWLRALGEAVTSGVALGALARLDDVFPFSFDDDGVPWDCFVRVVLLVAVVGTLVGILANVVQVAREVRARTSPREEAPGGEA